ILQAYADRLAYWRDSGQFRYGLVFKNQGHPAGASMAHLHSQLVALPFVPPAVEAEQRRAADWYGRDRSCPYCDLIAKEQGTGERIILVREGLIALCPFASWQPYEIWVMPMNHEPAFELMSHDRLRLFAEMLHEFVTSFESIRPGVAYNMLLRTAPWV